MQQKNTYLKIIFLTVLAYRLATYLVIYFWGNTTWWNSIYTDKWDHYQIGIFLIFISVFLKKYKKYYLPALGIGTGMIIDEISDIIKLLNLYPLSPNFRDSFPDLLLITATFIIFALIIKLTDFKFKRSG